jgi:predicted PurR-regulated permease PerM
MQNMIKYVEVSTMEDKRKDVETPEVEETVEEQTTEKEEHAEPGIMRFFRNKSDGLDYRSVNFVIKLVGALAALALLILIIESIGSSIFQPLFTFLSILTPFIVGIVFAWLLTPVVAVLVKRNWKPGTASFVVTLVGVFMLAVLIGGFGYVTLNSIIRFFTGSYDIAYFLRTGRDIVTLVNDNITEEFNKGGLLQLVVQGGVALGFIEKTGVGSEAIYMLNMQTGTSVGDIIGTTFNYFWKAVISAVVVGFMLPNFSSFGSNVKSIIPKNVKEEWSNFIDIIGSSFSDYMNGALMIAGIVGSVIATGIGIIAILSSTIFATPGATSILSFSEGGPFVILTVVVFGILAALTNLIPYAGPFIGGIPIVIIVALNDSTPNYWVTLGLALVIIITQSLESLFLQPYVMGRQTRLHPVAILLGLTLFGSLWGIVGMLISTPLLSVARSTINYYNAKYDIF